MSENESQRPENTGDAGETQQQPRMHVEPTPQQPEPTPYVKAYGFPGGAPSENQQVVNKHTVVKTKTKKLPIFITALAGCACGALLVIALVMTGALNIGGGKNSVTANATGGSSSSQKITIDSEDTTLAEAVSAKALPSVVSITATSSSGQSNQLSQSSDESSDSGSIGSGVVLDTKGDILTNNHVVDGYDQLVVTMDDGTTYEAELVGNDSSSDLAVIKLKDADASKLTPIEIGDSSKLNVGEWVMAIGSPFGNEQSVSTGIVSALYRSTAMSSTSGNTIYANMIQTDAAINPGNSGGALFDSYGNVIGIVYAKSSSVSIEGIGYAIPVNNIKDLVAQMINDPDSVKDQTKGSQIMLGITIRDITEDMSKQYSMPVGVYITEVSSMSAAERAGLQKGDIITEFAGETVTSADDLNAIKAKQTSGDTVSVKIDRNGKEMTLDLVVPQPTDVDTTANN